MKMSKAFFFNESSHQISKMEILKLVLKLCRKGCVERVHAYNFKYYNSFSAESKTHAFVFLNIS